MKQIKDNNIVKLVLINITDHVLPPLGKPQEAVNVRAFHLCSGKQASQLENTNIF